MLVQSLLANCPFEDAAAFEWDESYRWPWLAYVDNFWVFASSLEECVRRASWITERLEAGGLAIDPKSIELLLNNAAETQATMTLDENQMEDYYAHGLESRMKIGAYAGVQVHEMRFLGTMLDTQSTYETMVRFRITQTHRCFYRAQRY